MSLNSASIQRGYNNIYKQLRNYIWPMYTVEKIVDFELSVYKALPDLDEVRNTFDQLCTVIYDTIRDDDELSKEISEFRKLIDGQKQCYTKIKRLQEIVQ